MNIAAVVVTHNRAQLLEDALRALFAQTCALQFIVVVDNASSPETAQVLQGFENVDVLRLEENVGGAGGFAAGVERAMMHGADWMLLLDDDAIAKPDLVERLVDALPGAAEQRVGALCSSVVEFGRVALMHRRMFDPKTLREPVIPRECYCKARVQVDTASFVGFLLSARAAREVGLPNASFFLAYDDTEYSLRLGRAGWSIWLVPSAVVDHLRSPKGRLRNGPYATKHYYNLRNQLAVFRHYGTAPGWRLWLPIILHGFVAAKDLRLSSLCTWLKALRDSRSVRL
ncbi:glycosyltransferase [Mycetohabitans sp. B5]|uniref:GT2 family glycosyltransferase n=1 Tax=Mycetohabitans endofungorum TaxID=417203 RepID=A0A2P5KEQ3_9BURK|nr:glycosyltransferase [Mycetohabitans endofungorum]MCG1054016.1 glycosyltransferase [Mycetohabitans sp. B5]PPB85186.1 GT2 family glycosyltransferase [Mycetohabitans endofungorum]